MKYRELSVQAIFTDEGEMIKFFLQENGGKISMFDCAPSKAESVADFLLEASQNNKQ